MSWATDRDGSAGYVTVTALASVIDEAVPFCVVYLSDLPSGFHSAMTAASDTDGKTIRVSTSDGSTQLACVPLGVNTGTDTGCLIFLGTGMSASSDVSYRIYVGNSSLSMPSASGGMGEQAVFAAYAGVYFPGMSTRDFTSGGRTLTATGSPTTAASGYEGITAAAYNGSSQYHGYSGTQGATNWPHTFEALAYSTSSTANQGVVSLSRSTDGTNHFSLLRLRGDQSSPVTDPLQMIIAGGTGTTSDARATAGYSTSTWYYLAGDRDAVGAGTTHAYINGGSAGSDTTSSSGTPTFDRFTIGAVQITAVINYLAGRVAFAGLSSSVRSANFLATQHQNWLGNLYSTGSWTPAGNTGTGALTGPTTPAVAGSGYSKHIATGAPVAPHGTLSGAGITGKTGTGAVSAPAGTLSGSGYSKHSGTGAVSAPHPSLVSGSGYSKHTGTGAITGSAGTLSGSGTAGTTGSVTTNQSAAIANRSTRKSSGTTYKAAYINITLPDLTGQTITAATLRLNATLNAGPMGNIDVYARAESDTGAWDDSSLVATLDALSLGTAVSTGNTLSSGTGTKTISILGDSSKGVAKFYDDHPAGGDITVALVWSAFSGTPNGAFTSLTIGDDNSGTPEAIFSARSDATNYPRIILDYIGDPGNTGTGALTGPSSPAVSGSGRSTHIGTGSPAAPAGTLSGSGKTGKTGTGALTAPAGTLAGVGGSGKTGTGAITAPPATLAGSGASTHTGTGAITAPAGTLAGVGTGNTPVTGTGAIEAPMPLIASSGNIESGDQDLVGALTAPAGVIAGAAITGKTGTSALVAPKPVVAGSGKSAHTGTGALTAPHPSLIGGAGLNSPPAKIGTGALVGTVPIISGTGFVVDGDEATVDSIAWYLTGASAEGKSQRSQVASLGGFRSGIPVRSMTWDCEQPMVGVEILEVGALNGYGTGSLEAITDDIIAWTPPGGTQGTALSLLSGGEAQLFGLDSGAWIKVRRHSTIPMVGLHAVQCLDIYNNVVGFSNVASADAIAGKTYYRAIMGHNPYSGPMINLALWLDAAASTNIQIGYEIAVAGEIQTIADENTAPTGITFDGGTTDSTGLMIPSCPAGESFGIWLKMTIPADSDPSPRELNHIHIKFSDLTEAIHYDDLRGKYRIARNDYVTYGLWLGQDEAPDFSLAADEEFASRPHTTSLSLAPSHTYNAVVRQRNKWGLWSQNTTATPLVMDADGEQGFVPPSAPSVVAITQQAIAANYPIISARYEPATDGDNRAQFFVVWHTRDDSTPDTTDPPSGYGTMNLRAGIEALKFTASGADFVDETPIKAIVRTRRAAVGAGGAFSPDTTQLPASGAGTIVVASELAGWPSTGLMKVTTFSGSIKEIVEYSNLAVGTGVSTFTVLSGGRAQWGTTAAATLTNDVIYSIEAVDSTNTDVTEYAIDGIEPGRPWGELLFGNEAAQEQTPIEGPDGVTEEYIDQPNNIYLLLGEGWTELWMDTTLVWKVFQDGNASSLNAVYIPDDWELIVGSVSGAGTGVFDTTGPDDLYIVAGSTRRVHIDASAMTITAPAFAAIGDLPEVAPQSATWEQYAGSLLQSWDPQRSDYRPYAQLKSDGELGFQWTVDNTLTQSEIVAL